MANDFNFDDGRLYKAGNDVTPFDLADMLAECVEDNPEEIQGVIVVVMRKRPNGSIFEVGYTTDSVDAHLGRLECAKKVIINRFFEEESQ